jgi:SpoVK/Ycf46/Vps4 family AAA+-type ATPase
MLGALLTFMEETRSPVFVAATSNDHRGLPPEFLQRFERIFFVDAPTPRECETILQIHIAQSGRDANQYNLSQVSHAASLKGFVGRELRNCISDCLADAYMDGRPDISVSDISKYIETTTPMLTAKKSELAILREWARQNAVKANGGATEAQTLRTGIDIEV